MKAYTTILIILLLTIPAFAKDLSLTKNMWHFIPLEIPEGKAGGGDFYNIRIEPESSHYEFRTEDKGFAIRFIRGGTYDLSILVNHITKSSCAGVNVKTHSKKQILFRIPK